MGFDPKDVGRRMRWAREAKGWTQLEFSRQANVSPGTVSRWERGMVPPVRELIRLAGVLDIDPVDLVEPSPPVGAELVEEARVREILREELAPVVERLELILQLVAGESREAAWSRHRMGGPKG
jgi:transcriptional regulator with XRE-family HTH domain